MFSKTSHNSSINCKILNNRKFNIKIVHGNALDKRIKLFLIILILKILNTLIVHSLKRRHNNAKQLKRPFRLICRELRSIELNGVRFFKIKIIKIII